MPTIVGVQAAGCAPLAASPSTPVGIEPRPTAAEGIAIAAPARAAQILAAVAATGGTFVTVTDDETMAAKGQLAARGFYVEPTSAVCWAVLSRARSTETDSALSALRGNGVVIPLCGAGLKCAV